MEIYSHAEPVRPVFLKPFASAGVRLVKVRQAIIRVREDLLYNPMFTKVGDRQALTSFILAKKKKKTR